VGDAVVANELEDPELLWCEIHPLSPGVRLKAM